MWGHGGHIADSYVRAATTSDGRRTAVLRANVGALSDPSLELAVLNAVFCPQPSGAPPAVQAQGRGPAPAHARATGPGSPSA